MTSEARVVVGILNQLLEAEARTLMPRLAEAGAFVSWTSSDEQALLGRLVGEEREHQAALVDCILSAGGAPAPVTGDLNTASLNFLELHTLLPRILADKEHLAALYEAAGNQLETSSNAERLVRRLATAQREHVASLRRLVSSE